MNNTDLTSRPPRLARCVPLRPSWPRATLELVKVCGKPSPGKLGRPVLVQGPERVSARHRV